MRNIWAWNEGRELSQRRKGARTITVYGTDVEFFQVWLKERTEEGDAQASKLCVLAIP